MGGRTKDTIEDTYYDTIDFIPVTEQDATFENGFYSLDESDIMTAMKIAKRKIIPVIKNI